MGFPYSIDEIAEWDRLSVSDAQRLIRLHCDCESESAGNGRLWVWCRGSERQRIECTPSAVLGWLGY